MQLPANMLNWDKYCQFRSRPVSRSFQISSNKIHLHRQVTWLWISKSPLPCHRRHSCGGLWIWNSEDILQGRTKNQGALRSSSRFTPILSLSSWLSWSSSRWSTLSSGGSRLTSAPPPTSKSPVPTTTASLWCPIGCSWRIDLKAKLSYGV